MPIVHKFSVILPLSSSEVCLMLSDIQLHLSLLPIFTSLAGVLSDNEVIADLKIGEVSSRARMTVNTSVEGNITVIVLEGRDDLSLVLKLNVERLEVGERAAQWKLGVGGETAQLKPLTLIRGEVTVRSANEKVLRPHIKTFIDTYQSRLNETLPAVVEMWRKGLIKKVEPVAKVVAPAQEVKPPEAPPIAEGGPAKLEKLTIPMTEDPRLLEDEIKLSEIIIRSQVMGTSKAELSGAELLEKLMEFHKESAAKLTYLLATDAEGNKARFLIKDKEVVGVRIELQKGLVLNGSGAIEKLKQIGRKVWRVSIHSIPEDLLT